MPQPPESQPQPLPHAVRTPMAHRDSARATGLCGRAVGNAAAGGADAAGSLGDGAAATRQKHVGSAPRGTAPCFAIGQDCARLPSWYGLLLWAFRRIALTPERAPQIACDLASFLSASHDPAGFLAMCEAIARHRRRRIRLALPGYARLTADEVSLLNLVAAHRSRDADRVAAHLAWMLHSAGHCAMLQALSDLSALAPESPGSPAGPDRRA